ncbi:MAG TPA: CsbD family protein [Cytophagaceae bacterium]|jgi:uncharacterized protein YjbJ (UPF0337 family)|nr:CsbD family protein [Cytophagaceae bacterium]
MNDLKIKGSFRELLGKLKKKYGELTDDDVAFEEGKEDEAIGRLQKKLGKSKDEVIRLLHSDEF